MPRESVEVTAHVEKLAVVDKTATIQRHACKACGTHLFGRIENTGHAFFGLDFIHTELSETKDGRNRALPSSCHPSLKVTVQSPSRWKAFALVSWNSVFPHMTRSIRCLWMLYPRMPHSAAAF